MSYKRLVSLTLLAALGVALPAAAVDSSTFGGLEARAIGPAVMSGRVAALDAVAEDPLTIYVGAASGGVWKSTDGGTTFKPVFDDHIQSIGAIAIDPNDKETVWVGTGESWTRNSTSIGDGLYKTTDGGGGWKRVGLENSERIARIVIDPNDSSVVYVCATGQLWNANDERGLYKTTDGGESWEAVLQVDADTGCSDVSLDPEDSSIIYAGMWQFRRQPWTFKSGGPGSGLYKSTDGGASWRELTNGLPEGEKGRIAVDVAPSRGRTVYAVVEADETALYRSDDMGESFEKVSSAFTVQVRPFYFAYVVVDPLDHNRVYKPGLSLGASDDGGKTFNALAGTTHSDHHALWVNPNNTQQLLLGTDGGVWTSADRGVAWKLVPGLPLSQFYEISVDMEKPYNVYGGLQDNGTWRGPSQSVAGIENKDWQNIGFGDGFHAWVDPTENDYVYVEYQGGNILRHNMVTGETRDIRPLEQEGDPKYRFSWNTPIHISPSGSGRVYVGGQFVFRSDDKGASWTKISPDLTTNDPEKQRQRESGGLTIDNSTAENHTTVYTISESPLNGDVVWAGTDDGNLQVTRDGGESWTNTVANAPGLPPNTWVAHVAAGQHEEGVAYAAFDGHRTGDMDTHLYRTDDFGASWTSLAGEGIEGHAHVIIEDPVSADLLFAGTELGLFISVDRGATWARYTGNFPKVPVRDLAIHPREHDLVIGTHGRGIYIIDDITPLRHLSAQLLDSNFAILPSRPGELAIPSAAFGFAGDDEFVGPNRLQGASLVYYQKKRHLFGDLKVEIYSPEGELLTTLPGGKRKGLNRVTWSARQKAPKMPAATALVIQPFVFFGPRVPEGEYPVKVIKGKETFETTLKLVPDSRSRHSAEDRLQQYETAMAVYNDLGTLTYLVEASVDLKEQAAARTGELGERDKLRGRLEELSESLDSFRSGLVSTDTAGWLSGEELLREELGNLFGGINGYDGRPSQSQLDRQVFLHSKLEKAEAAFSELASADALGGLSGQLERKGLEPLALMSREAWENDQEAGGATTTVAPEPKFVSWFSRVLPRQPMRLH
jgi:photosystem II stability/assembly factor-like uncharacterized protein